jgi:membrane-bound lytic murein transglycosylase B
MQKNKGRFILQALTLLLSLSLSACTAYADKPEVHDFIERMVNKYHFDRAQLEQLFNTVKPNRFIIASFTNAKENLTWSDYKPIFVNEKRARQGANYWHEHRDTLQYAQKHYGVPPAIILAILGVETRYGEITGKYKVLDSLSILSFNHSRRAYFFQNELEQFLLLSRENPVINPKTTKGSYAGAIGQGQFMPSSYRRLAVDASHKGYSDLINNADDTLLSIANYLKCYGWLRGGLIAKPVNATRLPHNQALPDPLKSFTIKHWEKYHIYPQKPLPAQLKASLITLPTSQDKEYWLGFNNFQVIKRYNSSALYAMAVTQLSELINHYYQQEYPAHDKKK